MKKQTFRIGDIVTFGTLDGSEIEWKILTIDRDDALITSRYGVALHAYHDDASPTTWETCTLRHWLNHDFLTSAFSEEEQEKIRAIALVEDDSEIVLADQGTTDKVFILSEEETERYFAKPTDRVLLYNRRLSGAGSLLNGFMTTCRWWMRGKTGEFDGRSCVPVCDYDGSFGGYQIQNLSLIPVRPAMWVDLSALRHAEQIDIDHLNVRLKKGELGTLTTFWDGFEIQRHVYARFVDYETQEEYVIYHDRDGMFNPYVAKVKVDDRVGSRIRKKAEILQSLLSVYSYDDAADQLLRKTDETRVRAWMNQVAWASSSCEELEIEEGAAIRFGKMPKEKGKSRQPISWIVLKRSGSKALLIMEKGIRCDTFMDDNSDEWEWEYSSIREWLNDEFYNGCFSRQEKKRIQKCMTECGDYLGRVRERDAVYDHVFLISDAEANVFFRSDASRKISGTPDDVSIFRNSGDVGDWWWLRSQGDTSDYICCVDPDGMIDRHGRWVHSDVCAIRPAILIDLSCDEYGNLPGFPRMITSLRWE